MKRDRVSYALLVILAILVGAVIGDNVNKIVVGWQRSQELEAAHSVSQLSAEQESYAIAQNERAMGGDLDCLPNFLADEQP